MRQRHRLLPRLRRRVVLLLTSGILAGGLSAAPAALAAPSDIRPRNPASPCACSTCRPR
ncbi:hypothetical protein SFUMM280S_10369 [Streptomyces fumanus]